MQSSNWCQIIWIRKDASCGSTNANFLKLLLTEHLCYCNATSHWCGFLPSFFRSLCLEEKRDANCTYVKKWIMRLRQIFPWFLCNRVKKPNFTSFDCCSWKFEKGKKCRAFVTCEQIKCFLSRCKCPISVFCKQLYYFIYTCLAFTLHLQCPQLRIRRLSRIASVGKQFSYPSK